MMRFRSKHIKSLLQSHAESILIWCKTLWIFTTSCLPQRWLFLALFFRKCDEIFSDLQISKKNIPKSYPELEISLRLKLKFQAQDSFFGIFFFFRFGDLKNTSHFLKKATFRSKSLDASIFIPGQQIIFHVKAYIFR